MGAVYGDSEKQDCWGLQRGSKKPGRITWGRRECPQLGFLDLKVKYVLLCRKYEASAMVSLCSLMESCASSGAAKASRYLPPYSELGWRLRAPGTPLDLSSRHHETPTHPYPVNTSFRTNKRTDEQTNERALLSLVWIFLLLFFQKLSWSFPCLFFVFSSSL